jgi:hypothetical protein
MATKDLNWNFGTRLADGIMYQGKSTVTDWIMTKEKEQINSLRVVDGIKEPLLLNKVCGRDDLRYVAVPSEVIEKSESHDPVP